ncbi:hypothetical protein TNIN_279491 [Trichonephila inaurata madagascariensis]|uniref:Uncharacterized protein n=1 Tax=Trichonephila inaurata madagascariensis TaxID=2747483 RepID=A0A8X7BSB7_9ARAC|nr:hypothetical protein TNIN_279491 [Trichonephila inaurata madagascariensis]
MPVALDYKVKIGPLSKEGLPTQVRCLSEPKTKRVLSASLNALSQLPTVFFQPLLMESLISKAEVVKNSKILNWRPTAMVSHPPEHL